MLYIFAGFPKNGFNAGGLQYCIEENENLCVIEHDPAIQYRREGKFFVTKDGEEFIGEVEAVVSSSLIDEGITWDWFPPDFTFGNGVTIHKTTNEYHDSIVFHIQDGQLKWTQVIEDRSTYEARWAPDTCPKESHVVHLTWIVTTHLLPYFAYERIRALIENGAQPVDPELYEQEPGQ